MEKRWTDEQLDVINLRNRNILVSAAAGSGKTAVLVERIIKLITDRENRVDIDKLVVVTFTKAAAESMRERIRDALEKMIEADPNDVNLQKQVTLINNAQITTIDSFCLNIIRNNYTTAGIEPGFKIADTGEIILLKADVMADVLEQCYKENNEDFINFIESYGTGKTDKAIEDMIYKLTDFARSYPWPKEWLLSCKNVYECKDVDEFVNSPTIQYIYSDSKQKFEEYLKMMLELADYCTKDDDSPKQYEEAIKADCAMLKAVVKANDINEIYALLREPKFQTLSRVKSGNQDKKDYVKKKRDLFKNFYKGMSSGLYSQSKEEMFDNVVKCRNVIETFIDVTIKFYETCQEEKRERNIIDFNDMEHLALDILIKNEDGKISYTETADSLSHYYKEILIDEYQDSNYLQEYILMAVSGHRFGDYNMFMVGDVKQSIYKFRLARPELFIAKYDNYTYGESKNQKIELKKNFRSRSIVLDSANDIFFNIMKKDIGKIEYDENNALNCGSSYPEPKDEYAQRISSSTDIILVDFNSSEVLESSREIEAKAIADKIHSLMDKDTGLVIYDSDLGEYRNIEYKDIVILTRTVSGWAEVFVDVLLDNGIPAMSEDSSGYFNSREINVLLSMLSVIDNPQNDIDLAAVMTSYFGGFTYEELAVIKAANKKANLYTAVMNCEDKKLTGKIAEFTAFINELRDLVPYTDVHDIIWKIVYETGYYDYTGQMPAGNIRQQNIDILIAKAKAYENTSYTGLFNFLRYIEKAKRYGVEFDSAVTSADNESCVKIMSIHKSKGLEFPVVILAGISKEFNNMDANSSVVMDADIGIGTNYVDFTRRTKSTTIVKNAISEKIRMDNLAEELRILYVALTRAKDKVILTGCVSKLEEKISDWVIDADELVKNDVSSSFIAIHNAKSYMDLIMPIAMKLSGNQGKFIVNSIKAESLSDNMDDEPDESDIPSEYSDLVYIPNEDVKPDSEADSEPDSEEDTEYKYEEDTKRKAKVTVSELKKMFHDITEEDNEVIEEVDDSIKDIVNVVSVEDIVPEFILGKQKVSGSDRGTAYHRVMECLDYNYAGSIDSIKEYLQILLDEGKISQTQLDAVNPLDIEKFCSSELGQRASKAFFNRKLWREQPFVLGVNYDEGMNTEKIDPNRLLLVQGVIDMYFFEEDSVVLVDYKTDNVAMGEAGEKELIARYKVQLDYYEKALNRLLPNGRKVSQKIIYSFKLAKEIIL